MPAATASSRDAPDPDGRRVFDFDQGASHNTDVLGGKGAGLVRLAGLGLPVPPGFIVSCVAGLDYLRSGTLSSAVLAEIRDQLDALEATTRRRFNDGERPLLVSVRSGAPVSMPGMMDTVLNVGLTPATVRALAAETSDEAFAWACYARMAESYARIVRGVDAGEVEDALLDATMSVSAGQERSRATVEVVQQLLARRGDPPIPDDALVQIHETIEAVFRSWQSPRAEAYRRFRDIDDRLGTAAVVQTMVFGNRGDTSGSGVAFTRNPSDGEPGAFGDFLFDAQGEDVVDGSHDPLPLSDLQPRLPATYEQLCSALVCIERQTGDLCEVEFTVDEGTLWILQTRVGQRSGRAAIRTAVDMVAEGIISPEEAARRVSPAQLEAAAAPAFARAPARGEVLMRGTAASPGAVVGVVVFDVERAVALNAAGESVILVRPTTSPSDVAGFIASRGVVTGRGGRTSHAAVVARGMGRPAVCGVGDVVVAPGGRSGTVNGTELSEGTLVSLDGSLGVVAAGELPLDLATADPELEQVLSWAARLVGIERLDASPEGALVFDDPTATSLRQANAAIADANAAGSSPPIMVSARFAASAERPLEGRCRGVGCLDRVVSWPALVRGLTPPSAADR